MIGRNDDELIIRESFYKMPEILNVFVNHSFPLPTSPDKLSEFFASAESNAYVEHVRLTITNIKNHCINHHLPTNVLDIFLGALLHTGDASKHFPYTDVSYQLYTESVNMLTNIARALDSDELFYHVKHAILSELSRELYVCAPGCYTIIQNCYQYLTNDPYIKLMEIRYSFAQQCALELIQNYNHRVIELAQQYTNPQREDYIRTNEIYEGNITHYAVSIMNHYHVQFAYPYNDDSFAPDPETLTYFNDQFNDLMPSLLTIENIIQAIILNLQVDEYISNLNKNPNRYMEITQSFATSLNSFGEDKLYVTKHLIDEDELLTNGVYALSPYAYDNLKLSILRRLENLQQICPSIYYEKIELTNGDVLMYLRRYPIDYSYVLSDGLVSSVIEYCVNCETNNCNELPYQVSEIHCKAIQKLMWEKLKRNPLSRFVICEPKDYYRSIKDLFNLINHSKIDNISKLIELTSVESLEIAQQYFKNALVKNAIINIDDIYRLVLTSILAAIDIKDDSFSSFKNILMDEEDFTLILRRIPDIRRLQFLLIFTSEELNQYFIRFSTDEALLPLFLYNFNRADRFTVLLCLSSANHHYLDIKTPAALSLLLKSLPYETYMNVILFKIGKPKMNSIIKNMDDLIYVLRELNDSCRNKFWEIMGCGMHENQLGRDISLIGRVMHLLNPKEEVKFLCSWWDLSNFFLSAQHLIDYFGERSKISNFLFMKELPRNILPKLIADHQGLASILSYIPTDYCQVTLELIGYDRCRAVLPNYVFLREFINILDADIYDEFLKHFTLNLTDAEVDQYEGGDNSVYHQMLMIRTVDVVAQVSSQGLFAPRAIRASMQDVDADDLSYSGSEPALTP